MSTGNVSLDILLQRILATTKDSFDEAARQVLSKYPSLSAAEAREIAALIIAAPDEKKRDAVSLVVTAPPSFSIKAKATKTTVEGMIRNASSSILITGYSLSDYFSELVDEIILKSQRGIFVKFFVNDIEHQAGFDRILRYKGRFLKVYNFPKKQDDKMAALHAKVISTDRTSSIITSR